jgi:ribosomal protein L19E
MLQRYKEDKMIKREKYYELYCRMDVFRSRGTLEMYFKCWRRILEKERRFECKVSTANSTQFWEDIRMIEKQLKAYKKQDEMYQSNVEELQKVNLDSARYKELKEYIAEYELFSSSRKAQVRLLTERITVLLELNSN